MNPSLKNLPLFAICALGLSYLPATLAQTATYPPYPPSDIDIYGQVANAATKTVPNVLFILDNSSNWNADNGQTACTYKDNGVDTGVGPATNGKKFSIEQCALYNVIDALKPAADGSALYNIGFMLFNETNVESGARVIRALTPLDAAGKEKLKQTVRTLTDNQSPAPSSYDLSMYEAYLYFTQGTPYSGQRTGTLPYDPAAFSNDKKKYELPASSGCGGNVVIMIANGPPQGDYSKNADIAFAKLKEVGGNTSPITYTTGSNVDTKDAANWTDEFARFLQTQGTPTYTIAVTGAKSDKVSYPAIFQGVASAGGGSFYEAKSASDLELSLGAIFNQLQAVDSVFASASLPVSVNSRGTYDNQVFMGMFRPDAQAGQRWRGNLKQYQFSYDQTNDQLYLSSVNGQSAINPSTGFFDPKAISNWTKQPAAGDTGFWINQPMGANQASQYIDYPDGEVVEKGGAAQQLRIAYATNQTSRRMYTCIGCVSAPISTPISNPATSPLTLQTVPTAPLVDVNTSSITPTALGVADTTQRDLLVNWMRGTDNQTDANGNKIEKGPGGTTTIRPSVHGDVLHSRPAVVNYGTASAPAIVVFYGGNDGLLHAINGNRDSTIGSINAGEELWSFLPEEHFSKLKRLRNNVPEVGLSTSTTSLALPRDYFVDGPISLYRSINAAGQTTRAYLYVGMRRGGRFIYALDVTDPINPKYLWKITSGTTGFSQLGQTWSEPRLGRVRGNANPVLIMGGGYDDKAEDTSPPGTTTMGNAVFVIDAFTGALVKKFDTDRSVPADVSLVHMDSDNRVDRAYAVDTGGTIYRIDFEKDATVGTTTSTSTAVADWGIYKLATLGNSSNPRKFFYAPDVVMTNSFTAVQAGSGDREKPRDGKIIDNTGIYDTKGSLTNGTGTYATSSYGVNNYFFTVFDDRMEKGSATGFTPITLNDLTASGTAASTSSKDYGCYLELAKGEKVVNAATTFRGETYFGTNNPNVKKTASDGSMCPANLGQAKTYTAPQFCAKVTSQALSGGGLPPSPVAGFVSITYNHQNADGSTTPTTATKEFVIGKENSKGSAIDTGKVKTTLALPRKRRYWFQESTR